MQWKTDAYCCGYPPGCTLGVKIQGPYHRPIKSDLQGCFFIGFNIELTVVYSKFIFCEREIKMRLKGRLTTKNNVTGRFALILMCIMALGQIAACGKSVPEAVEETSEAAKEEAGEETASEEVFTEPAQVVENAYFEENNITFSDKKEFDIPFAAGTYDPEELNYKEYKGVTVEPQGDAHLTIGEIKPAKCEKEGYKAFTLEYDIEGVVRTTVDTFDYDENYSYEPQFPHIDLTDYYTGKLLPYYPTLERDEEGYDYIERLVFNDQTTEVAYYNLADYGPAEEGDWQIDEASDDSRFEFYDTKLTEHHLIEIRIPEGFDGLVLAIDLNGISEYDTSEYREYQSTEKRLVFEADSNGYSYKPETSAFIRIADM